MMFWQVMEKKKKRNTGEDTATETETEDEEEEVQRKRKRRTSGDREKAAKKPRKKPGDEGKKHLTDFVLSTHLFW